MDVIGQVEKLEEVADYKISRMSKMGIVFISIAVIATTILLNGASVTHHARQAEFLYKILIIEVFIFIIISIIELVRYGISLYNPKRWVWITGNYGYPANLDYVKEKGLQYREMTKQEMKEYKEIYKKNNPKKQL
jgi:nitric oxide reductase large subunit